MPGTSASGDVLQQTVDGFAQRVQQYADGIAGRLGQPMSGTQLSQQDAVARWNFTPLGTTAAADAQYHQLVAQGTAPGQALNQVYPMRSMLFSGGADVQDSIATARQIAGWAASATGSEPVQEPQGSTLPILMAQQQPLPAPPQGPQMAGPPGPAPLPTPPVAQPGAMPPPMIAPPPPGSMPLPPAPATVAPPMPVGAGV